MTNFFEYFRLLLATGRMAFIVSRIQTNGSGVAFISYIFKNSLITKDS